MSNALKRIYAMPEHMLEKINKVGVYSVQRTNFFADFANELPQFVLFAKETTRKGSNLTKKPPFYRRLWSCIIHHAVLRLYKVPRNACSLSILSNKALKFPAPNPLAPIR